MGQWLLITRILFRMNRVLNLFFFKKKKEGKERKGKRVMWLASRLAFSFFGMEGALSSKKEPKKGSGNAERNRVTSHGMDPRGQIVHLTSSR